MNGFLFDENLPAKIQFTPSLPITHVSVLRTSPTDTEIWQYAKERNLVIVTKDADFSDRLMLDSAPPTVVHLRFGNMRKREFHHISNTLSPCIVVGRKGSYGKVTFSSSSAFVIDTAYSIDENTLQISLNFRWLYYALSILGLDSFSQDTGVPGLSREFAHNRPLPFPPIAEQKSIARFLDRETTRIDTLITKKRQLIDLLQKKRDAIIHQAVTKGLDPNIPLKDSGIPWIGEIPTHWKCIRLGYFSHIGNGSTPNRDEAEYWSSYDFPWLNSGKINDLVIEYADQYVSEKALRECHLPVVSPNSILVAITGEGQTRGRAALLKIESTINQHLAYITPDFEYSHHEYLWRQLQASYQ
jgi:type I restriction enzyme, S subunit